PLTRTRVRAVPRPRRSSRLRPAVPRNRVEFAWVKVLRIDGRSASLSPTETLPVWKNSSPPIEVTGSGDSRFGRRMRVPVTVIAFVLVGVQFAGSGCPLVTPHAFAPDLTSCSVLSACGGDLSDL